MDPEKSNEINSSVNECPICYVSTIITSKFKCSHKVCNNCFRKQLESEQKLACSLCRAKICIKKLTKGQKKIYQKRDNQHILHFTPLPNNNEETEIPNIRIRPIPSMLDFHLPTTPWYRPTDFFFPSPRDRFLEENSNNNLNQET